MFSKLPVRTFVTVVHQAEVAYRELLGANRIRLEPGLRLDLPILHSIRRIDMREAMIDIPELHSYTKDNVPVKANGTLFYKVTDAEKACYEVKNYKKAVKAVGESSFRAVLGRFEFHHIISNRNELNNALEEIIGDFLKKWGIECSRCEVQHIGPQNAGVAHQLEKQMRAERRRRENNLYTQANKRSAEGLNSETTLKSEGLLQSEGKTANALNYKMDMKAKALAEQVKILSQATDLTKTEVEMLLEMNRLEHLAAIAKGENRVYFMDPKKNYPVPLLDEMK